MTDRTVPRHLRAPLRAVTLLAIGVLAIGCKKQIDSDKAEKVIGEKLAENGFQATVACPKDQELEAGATFTCEATLADGTKLPVHVTQKDNEGNVAWKPDGTLLDTNKIVADAKAKLGDAAVITCPRRIVVLKQAGDTTSCTVKSGEQQGNLEIKLENAETGAVTWQVKPA